MGVLIAAAAALYLMWVAPLPVAAAASLLLAYHIRRDRPRRM